MTDETAAPAMPSTTPASPGGGQLPSDTISQASTPSDEGGANEFAGLDPSYEDTSTDFVELPEQTAPEVQEPQTADAPPAAPSVVPPPVQTQPAQAPQPTQQTTPAATEQRAEQAPPKALSEQLVEHRGALINELAKTRFALSQQEVEAFEADPSAAMPQFLAKVYYETMTSVVNHIQNNVPGLIQHVMDMSKQSSSAEDRFFSKFNAIDRTKHAADVKNFAIAFRQANPKVGEEELFSLVGAAVMAKYGLQPKPNGAAVQQPQPYVPARPGASVKVTPEAPGPWDGLGMDFD